MKEYQKTVAIKEIEKSDQKGKRRKRRKKKIETPLSRRVENCVPLLKKESLLEEDRNEIPNLFNNINKRRFQCIGSYAT